MRIFKNNPVEKQSFSVKPEHNIFTDSVRRDFVDAYLKNLVHYFFSVKPEHEIFLYLGLK